MKLILLDSPTGSLTVIADPVQDHIVMLKLKSNGMKSLLVYERGMSTPLNETRDAIRLVRATERHLVKHLKELRADKRAERKSYL